jgi:hypothetical protein
MFRVELSVSKLLPFVPRHEWFELQLSDASGASRDTKPVYTPGWNCVPGKVSNHINKGIVFFITNLAAALEEKILWFTVCNKFRE